SLYPPNSLCRRSTISVTARYSRNTGDQTSIIFPIKHNGIRGLHAYIIRANMLDSDVSKAGIGGVTKQLRDLPTQCLQKSADDVAVQDFDLPALGAELHSDHIADGGFSRPREA